MVWDQDAHVSAVRFCKVLGHSLCTSHRQLQRCRKVSNQKFLISAAAKMQNLLLSRLLGIRLSCKAAAFRSEAAVSLHIAGGEALAAPCLLPDTCSNQDLC